ncbi:17914_t:CDS:2 [Acaulospora morrowiae]|uniref:17914_t:CDS:1 n=1 Tax=Acaulospora morrowiae TaxID=94023 RepID=A0A9N9D4H4_9GLOM|nr:17914_t:CDS:2 [Acaulospora morrowiae]
MLVPRQNALSSGDLITCERAMLKFLDGKLGDNVGMDLKVWNWSIPELYGIVLGMIVKIDLAGTLNIRKSEMLDFIIDVEKGYCNTPYHSFYHAVDVVAVLYYMLTDLGAAKYLTPLDSICLLIAGLCHDIGHVNARTELAIRYNEQSVLENYSCTLTMELLTKHKLFRHVHTCNDEYLGCDPKEVDTALRNLITKTILSTDMTFHFDILESLHNMIEAFTSCSSDESGEEMDNSCNSSPASSISSSPISSSPIFTSPISSSPISSSPESSLVSPIAQKSFPVKTNNNNIHHLQIRLPRPSAIVVTLDSEQREILLKVLIHAADLSNTVRPWSISKRWSDLVVDEFFHQGDLEKENNLPVSPNMDREQVHQCQISLGFGDYVVKPYFEAFASFLPQASIFLDILAENRVLWDNMKNAPPQPAPTSYLLAPPPTPTAPKEQQRRVSLAAGLLIIPDDIQEKLRLMSSPRSPRLQRKLKRSLSGRSYSHHSLLSARHASSAPDDDDEDYGDDGYRRPTRRKSENPNANENSSSITNTNVMMGGTRSASYHYGKKANNQQRRLGGRVRRSSSLDHNMIRQITALYGTGDAPSPSDKETVVAGS